VGNVPVLKPQDVIRLLQNLGFREVRQRGSHKQFRHADGRATTVPFHKGRDISPILLRKIAEDINVALESLLSGNSH
jgi:predicted RNA binding protein YcfA (HicA-like mRNA interferase family)